MAELDFNIELPIVDAICTQYTGPGLNASWLLLALAAPHALYAFIWLNPFVWVSFFKEKPANAFASVAMALKALQFIACFAWVMGQSERGVCFDLRLIRWWQALVGAALIGLGQSLNLAVYHQLGLEGVYYGNKFGYHTKWVHGFPFNVSAHPQYVGSVLSLWGVAALLCTQPVPGVVALATYWTGLYAFTGCLEGCINGPTVKPTRKIE